MLPQCLFLWSEAITIKQFAKISTVIQTFVFSSIFSPFNIAENEMKSSYSGIAKVIIKVLIGISVFFMVKEEELESGSSVTQGEEEGVNYHFGSHPHCVIRISLALHGIERNI